MGKGLAGKMVLKQGVEFGDGPYITKQVCINVKSLKVDHFTLVPGRHTHKYLAGKGYVCNLLFSNNSNKLLSYVHVEREKANVAKC